MIKISIWLLWGLEAFFVYLPDQSKQFKNLKVNWKTSKSSVQEKGVASEALVSAVIQDFCLQKGRVFFS